MNATQADFDEDIQVFYGTSDESQRLTKDVAGRVEYLRVQKILRALAAPHSTIYDIGGATGIHSTWLAEDGHTVTLVDPVASQVAKAQHSGTFTAVEGDARTLPLESNSADITLLFGPLYHLVNEADRITALREAARVTKPGGTVLAAGISRMSLFAFMRTYGEHIGNQRAQDESAGQDTTTSRDQAAQQLIGDTHMVLPSAGGQVAIGSGVIELLERGTLPRLGQGFPCGHCHTLAELCHEVESAGMNVANTFGVEGPNVSAFESLALPAHQCLVNNAVQLAEAFDAPGVPDATKELSAHLLVVAKVI